MDNYLLKMKKWQMEDEQKKLQDMQEVHERLQANHEMYLKLGDYDAADRFADTSITKDSMIKKIAEYEKKIKRQKNKIEEMEMEMERNKCN